MKRSRQWEKTPNPKTLYENAIEAAAAAARFIVVYWIGKRFIDARRLQQQQQQTVREWPNDGRQGSDRKEEAKEKDKRGEWNKRNRCPCVCYHFQLFSIPQRGRVFEKSEKERRRNANQATLFTCARLWHQSYSYVDVYFPPIHLHNVT